MDSGSWTVYLERMICDRLFSIITRNVKDRMLAFDNCFFCFLLKFKCNPHSVLVSKSLAAKAMFCLVYDQKESRKNIWIQDAKDIAYSKTLKIARHVPK